MYKPQNGEKNMNDRQAKTDYPIMDEIAERWSPISFEPKPLCEGELASLFEAARWAPSSMNAQPWEYIYARRENEVEFDRLFSCLNEGNQVWAHECSVLIVTVTNGEGRYAYHDAGLALENLAIQATSMGLHIHPMGGFSPSKATELLGIPEGHRPVAMIAVGYLADDSALDENLIRKNRRERVRKPISEFCFEGTWGSSIRKL